MGAKYEFIYGKSIAQGFYMIQLFYSIFDVTPKLNKVIYFTF